MNLIIRNEFNLIKGGWEVIDETPSGNVDDLFIINLPKPSFTMEATILNPTIRN